MSQGLITIEVAKSNFFDRTLVQNAIGKGRARAMAQTGGFIRTDMRRSIKPPRRMRLDEMPDEMRAHYKGLPAKMRPLASSKPGEAPRGRTKRLKNSILFAYDRQTDSGLIGPIHFPGSRSSHAPRVLEFGGLSFVRVVNKDKPKGNARKATPEQIAAFKRLLKEGRIQYEKKRRSILEKPVTIAPRPYVGPSLRKNLNRIPQGFRNLIRNS